MNKLFNKKTITLIIFLIICLLSFYIVIEVFAAKTSGRQPRVFGYSFHIVVSDSMEPELNRGDLILATAADMKIIKEGDYIIFFSPDPSLAGKTIVHKVKEVNSEDGEISFITTGIKEGAVPDAYPVKEIIGKFSVKSAVLGKIFIFISKIENLLFICLIIYLLYVCARQVKKIVGIKKGLKDNKKQ